MNWVVTTDCQRRSTIPVRMYLTQMGEIPLLTRAEELATWRKPSRRREIVIVSRFTLPGCVRRYLIRLSQEVLCGDQSIDKVIKLTPSSGEPSREDMMQRLSQNLATIELMYQENCV